MSNSHKPFTTAQPHGSAHSPRRLLWALTLLVLSFVAWAFWGQLDVVSQAPGVVAPETWVQNVQHLEGGIIRSVWVREGEYVEAGQPLVGLDTVRNEVEVQELRSRIQGLLIRIQRLEAEYQGVPDLQYTGELAEQQPRLVREALTLFAARQQRLQAQIRVQESLLEQHRQRRTEINARLSANQRILGFLREQVGMSERLLEGSLSNRMNHLDLLKELARVEGQITEDRALLEQVAAAIQETQEQITLIRDSFREEAQHELDEAQHNLHVLEQRIVKELDALARAVIRAPVSGTLKTLQRSNVGGVVPPGGLVAEIVPQDDRLVIDAQLTPSDVGYVRVGQPVQLRLASADGFRFDALRGSVEQISPDTLLNEEGFPFYRIRIGVEQEFFQRGDEVYPLFPGMPVQSAILTGSRSIMDYLLEPFLGLRGQALRER